MLYFLDILGTLAFAITGAFKAKKKGLHIFAAIFLGAVTALGGGTLRDLILGRVPLFYLRDYHYLLVAVLGSMATYYFSPFFRRQYSFFRFIDSVGLAAFVVIGVNRSFFFLFLKPHYSFSDLVLSFFVCLFAGMLTGVGGGIIRDALMAEQPFAFRRGSNYVLAAFLGSLIYYFLYILLGINFAFSALLAMALVLFLREVVSPFGVYKKLCLKSK